jgi:hypothetical protein
MAPGAHRRPRVLIVDDDESMGDFVGIGGQPVAREGRGKPWR